MINVTFDPLSPFPQDAEFGRGVENSKGAHSPPVGKSSFKVKVVDLAHGIDEELYEITAPDTLAPKSQAARDAIIQDRDNQAAEKQGKKAIITTFNEQTLNALELKIQGAFVGPSPTPVKQNIIVKEIARVVYMLAKEKS